MVSILTADELEEFKRILFPPGKDAPKTFNIKNLEVALKTFNLSITQKDLETIEGDLEKEDVDGEALMAKVLGMVEEKIKAHEDLQEVKSAAIFSLSTLIDILGQAFSDEEMEEMIAEGSGGDIDVMKILDKLDKEVMEVKDKRNRSLKVDLGALKGRIICLGLVISALGKTMSDDDLIDMLSDDNELRFSESGITNYSRLLGIIEHKMRAMFPSERVPQQKDLQRRNQITLTEVRDVMRKLGSAMVDLGRNSSNCNLEDMVKNQWDSEYPEVPKPFAKLIENAFGCEYDFDIFHEFRKLDPEESGRIKAEELRKMLRECEDALPNSEVDQIFRKAGVYELGEFRYNDFIQQLALEER